MIVMAGVHQDSSLKTSASREMQRHTPISNVGVVERWFEGFIFHQQSLFWRKVQMHFLQPVFEPRLALPDICCSGIAGAVCEPHRNIAAIQPSRDFDTVLCMLHRL